MVESIRFDKGRHPRGKIGFVVLAMEQTVEDDVFVTTPYGVGVHFTRIPMSNQVTAETLAARPVAAAVSGATATAAAIGDDAGTAALAEELSDLGYM